MKRSSRLVIGLVLLSALLSSAVPVLADGPVLKSYTPEEIAEIRAQAVPMPFPDPTRAVLTDERPHLVFKYDPADVPLALNDDSTAAVATTPLGPPKAAGPNQITDTTAVPYSGAVHIYIKFDGWGWAGCSGSFLNDDNTILTAGHCVYSHEGGGMADEIIVIPGDDGASQPFGSKNALNWATNTSWINLEDYRQDWAVISIGSFSGTSHFGYVFDTNSWYWSQEFQTAGYPADMGYPGNEMWWQQAGVDYVDSRMIRPEFTFGSDPYLCIPGQSGSGVYHFDGSSYRTTAVLTLASCHSVRLDQSIVNFISSFSNGCDGCLIDDVCYDDGENEQGNTCRWCDVDTDAAAWSTQDGMSCDDGFYCDGADTCQSGECVGSGDPCDSGETCDENLNSCVSDDDSDDDDQSDCGKWLTDIYDDCDLTFVSDGTTVAGQSAYQSCQEGAGAWACVGDCFANKKVDSCSTLAECLSESCGLTTESSGGDDDDDDDSGSCGC